MPLPSSGQISMGDINVELGRSRTTADTLLAGGSTPTEGSLFGLANNTVDKTAPHQISEFYGYNNATTTLQMDIYVNESVFPAYGYVNYNETETLYQDGQGTSSLLVNLSPTTQTVYGEGYSDNPEMFTVSLETYVNNTFVASSSGPSYANISLNTTAGNAYGIVVYVF